MESEAVGVGWSLSDSVEPNVIVVRLLVWEPGGIYACHS